MTCSVVGPVDSREGRRRRGGPSRPLIAAGDSVEMRKREAATSTGRGARLAAGWRYSLVRPS